ncbi:hypothetical protein GCM10008905_17500 [Clostridium malenominatum]|uniref:Uncharacterized protein n=1 Tax=Clostridium malenominatum TaxID=1539 RepID=A0ABN1IYQ8_9CLOT
MTIILLIFGFLLIGINVIALKKDSRSFTKIVNDEKESVNSTREIEDAIFNLQMELEEIKLIINENIKKEVIPEEKPREIVHNEVYDKSEKKNNVKIDEVRELLDKGMTLEDIAQKLQIGKGELLLIKELYLK